MLESNPYQSSPQSALRHQSIIYKTDYKTKKPDLKRHYVDEWGRFLDNHYDPEIHKKTFYVAMKSPDMYNVLVNDMTI